MEERESLEFDWTDLNFVHDSIRVAINRLEECNCRPKGKLGSEQRKIAIQKLQEATMWATRSRFEED